MTPHYDVLDLFAGSGWGVATKWLGLREIGVETMPEAIQTRDLNGLETMTEVNEKGERVGVSVADVKPSSVLGIKIHAGSPPCQTFSVGGKGAGRLMLNRVLAGIPVIAAGQEFRPDDGDPRTWLVLEPLRLALAARPTYIAWEQVPPVLPVWEACAEVLRAAHGYSVWTGNLQSEMYGVPQTRKRAFLIARLDGKEAGPPPATHSRYHERDPRRLDPGVIPWVSMAEALGWGVEVRPSFTVCGGGVETGGAEPFGRRAREAMWAYRNGNRTSASVREEDLPAPTVHFGARSNDVRWVQRSNYSGHDNGRSVPSPVPGSPPRGARSLDEPSSTATSKGFYWTASTGTNDELTSQWRFHPGGERDRPDGSVKVTPAEAAALQTFPPDHQFGGKKGKQFLQIGNAVPPVLAAAVLANFL